MHKHHLWSRLRPPLAAALCLLCLLPARAAGASPIRPAEGSAPAVSPPGQAVRPAQAGEGLYQRISRLLDGQEAVQILSQEELLLLRVRLSQNSALLARLEEGTLSGGELICLAQPACRIERLEEYRSWGRSHPSQHPAQVVLQVNGRYEQPPAEEEESSPFSALPNCREDRLERYAAWAAGHPGLAADAVVLQVNMDLDLPFYEDVQTAEDPDSLTVLVNKHYALPAGYAPKVEPLGAGYGTGSLRAEAAQAFRAMADGARQEGVSLRSVSAYRSRQTQQNLYNKYLKTSRQAVVDTFSARPGHSEHQTGLALDINTASTSAHFENTRAYAWLQAHCAQYGFLLRYPQGKEDITGYRFEPWHYRYVGTEIAQACMEQGITYEEYLALAES